MTLIGGLTKLCQKATLFSAIFEDMVEGFLLLYTVCCVGCKKVRNQHIRKLCRKKLNKGSPNCVWWNVKRI